MMMWDFKKSHKGMYMLTEVFFYFFYWYTIERGRMSGHAGDVITIKQTQGEMTERQSTYRTLTHTL